MRRNFLKFISLSIFSSLFFPFSPLFANTKKIINKNLTKKQKEIMFNEGTERPFSSDLLKESRKGFYHCANCGINFLLLLVNSTVALVGHHFQRLYLEHLKLR